MPFFKSCRKPSGDSDKKSFSDAQLKKLFNDIYLVCHKSSPEDQFVLFLKYRVRDATEEERLKRLKSLLSDIPDSDFLDQHYHYRYQKKNKDGSMCYEKKYNITPLCAASHHGYPSLVNALIKANADVNEKSRFLTTITGLEPYKYNRSPMESALVKRNFNIAKILYKNGANPPEDVARYLRDAASTADISFIWTDLAKNISSKIACLVSLIDLKVRKPHNDLLNQLKENANTDEDTLSLFQEAFVYACGKGNNSCVNWLIENFPFGIEIKNRALIAAYRSNHFNLVECLINEHQFKIHASIRGAIEGDGQFSPKECADLSAKLLSKAENESHHAKTFESAANALAPSDSKLDISSSESDAYGYSYRSY